MRRREPALHSRDVKTLAEARSEFARKRSPWLIAAVIVVLLVARGFAGEVTWRDGVAALAMLAIYPLGEWAIHVYLLHMRPFELRGRRVDPPAAKGHRAHHRTPNDLTIILLDPKDIAQLLLIAMPVSIALWAVPLSLITGEVPVAALLTAALTTTLLIGAYEWTHFLIHTAYRPRSRYYRTIWRTHRLHHFKNEHYWHGITNTIGDRVLGTFPDHAEVPRSKTARTLDPDASGSMVPR
jgi:sterol desaturase/sphingolipid hydroxylase (fatty acid hydroxylase superfamily)